MKFSFKSAFYLYCVVFFYLPLAHAEEKRIYQTDTLGNIQYHAPSYTIQNNGRIIQTDPIGNKQYQKQQYQIKGDKVYPVDTQGNMQHQMPKFVISNKSK